MAAEVSIPRRAGFKPAEVCTIAGVQPYILRSWEAEFPVLARAKKKGGARVYRCADVEMVLQIKALVYGDGLTLGAAHRKLAAGKEPAPSVDADAGVDEDTLLVGLLDSDERDLIVGVKQGLRGILELLSPNGQTVLSPMPDKTKDAVKKSTSARLPEENQTKAKQTAKTARPAKASTAVRATKAKKVARRKRSA